MVASQHPLHSPQASGLLESLRATTELGKWTSVKDSGKEQLLASLEAASSNGEARLPRCAIKPEVFAAYVQLQATV